MRLAALVWSAGVFSAGGLVAALVWVSTHVPGRAPAVAAGPIAQITAPSPGFKLREGRTLAVRIRVRAGDRPLQGWALRLSGPGHADEQLATGTLPVEDRPVAQVAAADLTLGEQYELVLDATDTSGATAEAQLAFLVPDPHYTLIPLEPGNFSRAVLSGLSVDASGSVTSFGGEPPQRGVNWDVYVFTSNTRELKEMAAPIGSNEGQQLSHDGERFFFAGLGTIDYFDLGTDALVHGPTGQPLFRVDRTGDRVAYQYLGHTGTYQYALYDLGTGVVRALPQDPQAVVYGDTVEDCPQTTATTPLISADGQTVAIISRGTFGLVPDSGNSCHVFVYDVPSASLRHVRSFPVGMALAAPVLSDDGRWLSFAESHIVAQAMRRDFGALLDLQTGELTDPIGGLNHETFDSVVSGDSSMVVLTTTADLDPRVGNADGSFELFAYDIAVGQFTQISDTTGGVLRRPVREISPAGEQRRSGCTVLLPSSIRGRVRCGCAAAQCRGRTGVGARAGGAEAGRESATGLPDSGRGARGGGGPAHAATVGHRPRRRSDRVLRPGGWGDGRAAGIGDHGPPRRHGHVQLADATGAGGAVCAAGGGLRRGRGRDLWRPQHRGV